VSCASSFLSPSAPPNTADYCRPSWAALRLQIESPTAAGQGESRCGGLCGHQLQLSECVEEWPIYGRADLYYGGTGYKNTQGHGAKLPLTPEPVAQRPAKDSPAFPALRDNSLVLVPVTQLLDRGSMVITSPVLHPRLAEKALRINPRTAEKLNLPDGAVVSVSADSWTTETGQIR